MLNSNLLILVILGVSLWVEVTILKKMVPPYKNGVRVGDREIVIFALIDILLIMLITFLVEAF